MRRAAGDVTGKTVAAQVRQASRHLGYAPDDWRPRELWYGRCASTATLADLKERFAAWREREDSRASAELDQRVTAVLRRLARMKREVAALEAEVGRLFGAGGEAAPDV